MYTQIQRKNDNQIKYSYGVYEVYKYQNVKFKIAKCKKFEIAFEKY